MARKPITDIFAVPGVDLRGAQEYALQMPIKNPKTGEKIDLRTSPALYKQYTLMVLNDPDAMDEARERFGKSGPDNQVG